MTQSTMIPDTTIGIDLGDKKSHICVLIADGEVQERAEVPTTMAAIRRRFEPCKPLRIAVEAGGQSGWISELLKELGHEVIVANPRKLRMIYENDQKSDAVGAEQLARVARLDVKLLHPIQHRDRSARADLNKARSRDLLVSTRTSMINHVRGVLKSFGARATNKAAPQFHTWIEDKIPSELAERGGKTAKKKAVIAVARKLAVLLHTLWRTGEVYEPLRNAKRAAKKQGAPNATTAVPA